MVDCQGRTVHPVTQVSAPCLYEALWDGYCYFHRKVADGEITERIVDGLKGPELGRVWSRPRQDPARPQKHPLDRLVEEWG